MTTTQTTVHRLTRDDLFKLARNQGQTCVSLYLPTHRTGKEIQQDPIRLKNLLTEAERQLIEAGQDEDDVRNLLAAVHALPGTETDEFWQHSSDGLAIFVCEDCTRVYRVPIQFDELVVVAQRFHIKPLLSYFQDDGHFYVLAASSNRVRLLEGTKHHLSEIDTELLPDNLRDALNIDEYQSSLQFHSFDGGSQGSVTENAMYHGHGGSSDSEKKKDLLKFFRKLDEGVQQFFGIESTPLLFAGVEYLFPIYQQANNYRQLLDQPITGNFDDVSPDELHAAAWKVVGPHFATNRERLIERFGTAAANGKGSNDLATVVRAAREGRVETLLLAKGVQQWGIVLGDSIELTNENNAEKEDILDFAAVQTLQSGGNVLLLDAETMPSDRLAAGVFRY